MTAGRSSHRRVGRLGSIALAAVFASSFAASSALGFEAFDGRLQAHGAFSSQLRAMNADYSEQWDVTQWYMIFNLEVELDLIQDTVGPIDLMSAFVRGEVRFDCIYSRGCGMFRSMNAYGNRSKSLPRRLMAAERISHAGRIRVADARTQYIYEDGTLAPILDPDPPIRLSGSNRDPLTNTNDPTLGTFANAAGADGFDPQQVCDVNPGLCGVLAGGTASTQTSPSPGGPTIPGLDVASVWPTNDNPFPALAAAGGYGNFRYAAPAEGGSLGPWLPENEFETNATSAGIGNPFDSRASSYALQSSVYNGYIIGVNGGVNPITGDLLFDTAGNPIAPAAPTDPPGSRAPLPDPYDFSGVPGDEYLNLVVNAATYGEDAAGFDPVTGLVIDAQYDINNNGIRDLGGQAARGFGALPYRPAPVFLPDGAGTGQAQNPGDSRGIFIPSFPLARALNAGDLEPLGGDYNFSQAQRAWNRGSSQRDEKELKEAYLDIEMFESQLWLRIGKQQIVWGKTELFRTTDQFNPSDAALASLPSLEESRIAMWSARGVWSFYEVGPFDDVRLELAFNFDDYQQTDIGACGEPYAPNVTCNLTFGGFAHGIFGFGLAGVQQPPSPWQSLKGWEVGARLEWRWERFSFALMDFYGYDDLPVIETLAIYSRNVDPVSGRPREIFSTLPTERPTVNPYTGMPVSNIEQIGTQGICVTGQESACLNPQFDLDGNNGIDGINPDGSGILAINAYEDTNGNGILDAGEDLDGDGFLDLGSEQEALTYASVAQQVFAYVCAASVGASAADREACALTQIGSTKLLDPTAALQVSIAQGAGSLLSGSPLVAQGVSTGVQAVFGLNVQVECITEGSCSYSQTDPTSSGSNGGFVFPYVRLDVNPGDLEGDFNPATNGQQTPCMDTTFSGAPTPCGGQGAGLIPLVFNAIAGGNIVVANTLGGVLSPEQEALLGCGPFWGTQCDDAGINFLLAEGSALFQSWPGVEGTVQNGDITTLWHTNQRVTSPETGGQVFAQQPGTRDWYFDRTRSHGLGPVCTTANFGGQLFEYSSDALENDEANGNQAILPGCRRKWKRSPDDPAFQADFQRVLALNLYGQDLACARERAANGGTTLSPECAGLGAEDSARVDPRSWSRVQDGDPDSLSLRHVQYQGAFPGNTVFLPPARDIDGTPTRAPDFFYAPAGLGVPSVFGAQTQNPALGAAFDSCDESSYPAALNAEYGGSQFVPCARGGHPMTGQPFASEMAALSWNFLTLLVQLELSDVLAYQREAAVLSCEGSAACLQELWDTKNDYEAAREVFMNPEACSFVNPAYCNTFRTLMGSIGLQRNIRRAGGNGVHGRRTFIWQSGGEAIITYNKRNVLGFSMDFAEDRSKSNWGMEFTWIEGVPVANANSYTSLDEANDFNLTISADRPTFINFLNSNRTFFFNWQMFIRYRQGWKKGFTDEGPWNFLTTFAVATAYFQDRLSPSAVVVYDVRTQAGAFLPQISYRFTQNFSAAVGMAYFFGKPDYTDQSLASFGPAGNFGGSDNDHLYKSRRNGGLAIVKDRDEVWARIRYTF